MKKKNMQSHFIVVRQELIHTGSWPCRQTTPLKSNRIKSVRLPTKKNIYLYNNTKYCLITF